MENSSNLFRYKISGSSGFILVLLVLTLIGLGERVLYDLSRVFVGPTFDYFDDLQTLIVHALFVMVLIVVAVFVNVAVAEKRQKYAIILIPYFILSIVLTIQVVLEAGVYFTFHHTQFQFYLVMSSLVIVISMLMFVVQRNYVPVEVESDRSGGLLGLSSSLQVIVLIGGLFLLMVFLSFARIFF